MNFKKLVTLLFMCLSFNSLQASKSENSKSPAALAEEIFKTRENVGRWQGWVNQDESHRFHRYCKSYSPSDFTAFKQAEAKKMVQALHGFEKVIQEVDAYVESEKATKPQQTLVQILQERLENIQN